MSYILDALRRADAERRRGQSPVLHDVAGLSLPRRPAADRATPAALAGGGAAAPAGLLWGVARHWDPGGIAGCLHPRHRWRAVAVQQAPAAPVAAPWHRLPHAASVTRGARCRRPWCACHPPRRRQRRRPRCLRPAPAPADERPLPASAAARTPAQRGGAAGLRGAVHSADRAQSFVLLAGQIVREGETLAPGIVLERIAPPTLSTTDTPLPDRRSASVSPTATGAARRATRRRSRRFGGDGQLLEAAQVGAASAACRSSASAPAPPPARLRAAPPPSPGRRLHGPRGARQPQRAQLHRPSACGLAG
jgi:general secretion pathway protein B